VTFLELVQSLQSESGAGSASIATVVGATKEALRLRNWVRRADLWIQSRYADWKFLWVEDYEFTTGSGTRDYAGPENLNVWDPKSFRLAGERLPALRDYDAATHPAEASGTPQFLYLLPSNRLRLVPTPNAAFIVTGDYWRRPVELDVENDTSESVIPEQFHPLIVYVALGYYANFEGAGEIKKQAEEGVSYWLPALEAHQLVGHQRGSLSTDPEGLQVLAE
jgi:hypothetical protein